MTIFQSFDLVLMKKVLNKVLVPVLLFSPDFYFGAVTPAEKQNSSMEFYIHKSTTIYNKGN